MWTRVFACVGVSECVSCATLCNIFFLICFHARLSACECVPLFRRHSSWSPTLSSPSLISSLFPLMSLHLCECVLVCCVTKTTWHTHSEAHLHIHVTYRPPPPRINQLKIFYAAKGCQKKKKHNPPRGGPPLLLL